MTNFLSDVQLRPVTTAARRGSPLQPIGLALGPGQSALEVLVTQATSKPTSAAVRSAWHERNHGRAAPLLLVALHESQCWLCGPAGDEPPVYEADVGQAERICREALEQPDRHAALRMLRDALPSIETHFPGLRNEGFFATHELEVGARKLDEWSAADTKSRRALGKKGEALLTALGFHLERCDQNTSILRSGPQGKKVAVAVLLQQQESPELPRFSRTNESPLHKRE